MTTKTETLEDVLREILEVDNGAFDALKPVYDEFGFLFGGDEPTAKDLALVQVACQIACRENNLGWTIETIASAEGEKVRATVYPRVHSWDISQITRFGSGWITCPALAISTALRHALKAEQP